MKERGRLISERRIDERLRSVLEFGVRNLILGGKVGKSSQVMSSQVMSCQVESSQVCPVTLSVSMLPTTSSALTIAPLATNQEARTPFTKKKR